MIDPLDTKMALATTQRASTTDLGVDLEGLKLKFFQSNLRLSEFAALYKQDVPGLHKQATKDGWLQQRNAFRETISADVRAELQTKAAEYEAKLDSMVHRSTRKLVRIISSILTAATASHDKAVNGEEGGKEMSLDDLPKIRSGVEALQQTYTLARKTAGLSPEPMPARGSIDLTKLTHDERKDFANLLKKASPSEH